MSKFRERVLDELARHGVVPYEDTPVDLIRDYINDLYVYEIRRLKAGLKAGRIPRDQYAAHVERLRDSYPILALPARYWREGE